MTVTTDPPIELMPSAEPHRTKRRRWPTLLLVLGLVAVAAGFAWRFVLRHSGESTPNAQTTFYLSTPADLPVVKVIHPKLASEVPITVEQLGLVEPYYQADLRARASGLVKAVNFDIGSVVKRGDVLIEIDVPDLLQEVARAESVIAQREKELKVAETKLKDAQAAVQVAAATVKQRLADVQAAEATRDLKKRRFERFRSLASRGDVVGSVVEEEEQGYLASEAAVTSAQANVERARADYSEAQSRVEGVLADIELKKSLIEVARKEFDKAAAVASFAKIIAPFDGVVVRRNVDLGSFVQNATTGTSEPLISLARLDLVTVSVRVPDVYATMIRLGTPTEIRVDGVAGFAMTAPVTRFAPSVMNSDRTMRVEVDLYNGDDQTYQQMISTKQVLNPKSPTDPLPARAFPPGYSASRLIPGMTATMKLRLGGYGQSYVLPSTAVYTRGGTSYVLLVEHGRTKQVPVRLQVNDGKTVRLALALSAASPDNSGSEVLTELNGTEEVVAARQLEVGEGTQVLTKLQDW